MTVGSLVRVVKGTSKKLLARRIGGIFSVIRYKNPSHRINYSCGFLFRLTKNILAAPRTMSF